MNIKGLLFTSAALLIFSTPSAFAQSQPAGSSTAPAPGTVGERKENQQDRIANGIQSGQLTAGETKNLETKEAGLNKEEHTMRSEDDGHLTAADPEKLNNQQNHCRTRFTTTSTMPTPSITAIMKWESAVKTSRIALHRV